MPLLIPDRANHYLKNAQYLAHLGNAAYCDVPDQYPNFEKFGITDLRAFKGQEWGTSGFVAKTPKCLLLAFRGSRDADAWVTNMTFRQVDGYGGKVHYGFARALEGIWDRIVEAFQSLPGNINLPLWITGHSLGAALATLAAPRLQKVLDVAGTYTFGQPRVGNPAFARSYGSAPPLYRFVNNEDFVPQVPLPWMWFTYQHVGQIYFFDREGRLSQNDHQWNKMAAALGRLLVNRDAAEAQALHTWALEDHRLGSYIRKIEFNARNGLFAPFPADGQRAAG